MKYITQEDVMSSEGKYTWTGNFFHDAYGNSYLLLVDQEGKEYAMDVELTQCEWENEA